MKHKQLHTTLTTALCVAGLSGPAAAVDGPVFTGIGDLTGDVFASAAYAVSGDGNTVVGWGRSDAGLEAIRWSWEDSIEGLGFLHSSLYYSYASGVSEDGSVVVGISYSTFKSVEGYSLTVREAFRWTEDEGMVGLGDLPGGSFGSRANDVSADGRVITGTGNTGSVLSTPAEEGPVVPLTSEAFLWTEEMGMVSLCDLPTGTLYSQASGVSADGAVVVGSSVGYSVDTLWQEAFRWTESTGMVGLGDLTGEGLASYAKSVSADGDTVVGFSYLLDGWEAFRWTESTGMVGLGDLPGGSYSSAAQGVSGDGAVIVGASNNGSEVFIWTESQGMRRLVDVLADDYDLDVGEWQLLYAWDVSDDGLVIVGGGTNPEGNQEGWVVCLRDECFEEEDDDDDHGGEEHQNHGDKGKRHRHHDDD